MFKKAITYIIIASLWVATGFTGDKGEKLKAFFEIEGKKGKIVLYTDAIYGSYDSYGKVFHYFGKLHMFQSKDNPEYAKIFSDLCVTNNAKIFELTISQADKDRVKTEYPCVFNFKQKKDLKTLNSSFKTKNEKSGIKTFEVKTSFNDLGVTLTPEAERIFNQNFKLKVVSL